MQHNKNMKKTINVLSIDTDYVRSPVSFENLIKFYLNYIDEINIKNILFSQTHSNFFYILEPLLKQNKTIDLVSVDHHHDIWYKEIPLNSFDSANWLGHYLQKKNFINNVKYNNLNFSIDSKNDFTKAKKIAKNIRNRGFTLNDILKISQKII